MSHPFQGGGPKGWGTVMNHPFKGGWGIVMSHLFQGGVGGRDESSKRGVSQGKGAPPITAKGRGCGLHQTPTGGGV